MSACLCDPPLFVSPYCTLHGAHEYHGPPAEDDYNVQPSTKGRWPLGEDQHAS